MSLNNALRHSVKYYMDIKSSKGVKYLDITDIAIIGYSVGSGLGLKVDSGILLLLFVHNMQWCQQE